MSAAGPVAGGRPFRVRLVHCGNRNPADPADRAEKNAFFLPMGIFGLAGVLREAGCEVEIIHADLEDDDVFDLGEPDAVGFAWHWLNQSLAVLETAALVKRRHPGVFVFAGGFTASYYAEEIITGHPQLDAVVRGDAELPLRRLGETRCAPAALSGIPNLVWRDAAGKVVRNEFSYVAGPADLEHLDFACHELLRHADRYRQRCIYWTHVAPANFAPFNFAPLFLLEVGRGCGHRCLFCGGSCTAQKLLNNRTRQAWRSPRSAFATIAKAVKMHGFKTIFTDFEFPGSDDWYLELFGLIRTSGLELDFAYSSWGLTSPALLAALSRTFRKAYVQFSPETADEAVRRRNKGGAAYGNAELEATLDAVAATPNVTAQLYFGYFLVDDSAAAVHATLAWVLRLLARYREKLGIAYLPFSTDPASELQRDPAGHQIAMEPANFADYLACLRREYRDAPRGRPQPDLRLFRPLALLPEQARELEERIELLNLAFVIHRRTLSALLRRPDGADTLLAGLLPARGPADPPAAERLARQAAGAAADAGIQEEQERHRHAAAGFTAKPLLWLTGQPGDDPDGVEAISRGSRAHQRPTPPENGP